MNIYFVWNYALDCSTSIFDSSYFWCSENVFCYWLKRLLHNMTSIGKCMNFSYDLEFWNLNRYPINDKLWQIYFYYRFLGKYLSTSCLLRSCYFSVAKARQSCNGFLRKVWNVAACSEGGWHIWIKYLRKRTIIICRTAPSQNRQTATLHSCWKCYEKYTNV